MSLRYTRRVSAFGIMDREWINGGAKCREERTAGSRRSLGTSPTAAYSNGQAAAVHISPKQLHCFSHNDGARVRLDRGGERASSRGGISRVPRRTTT